MKFMQSFFSDGVEEMMRNASCFVHVNDLLQFFKEARKANLCLYTTLNMMFIV